ncbi:MAG: heme o synthase [Planctomycetes bacterium]|nr:heme o synthase [Planctomycetota bacterium]
MTATAKSGFGDWLTLSKARIQSVSLTGALLCAWMASAGTLHLIDALHLSIGLTAMSCASAALNQIIEIDIDGMMARTRDRPLPTGRISMHQARAFTAVTGIGGAIWLAAFLNPLTAWLGVIMLITYCFVYTPLKRVTALNTVVGAIPGAMPLLIGWAAAGQGLSRMSGIIFAILFLWQFPHFLAIAWMYREDYERGGLKMLPNSSSSSATARQSIHYAIALFVISLSPVLIGFAGKPYFYGAVTLGLAFLACVIQFSISHTEKRARAVLISSIVYLPLLLALLTWDYSQLRAG